MTPPGNIYPIYICTIPQFLSQNNHSVLADELGSSRVSRASLCSRGGLASCRHVPPLPSDNHSISAGSDRMIILRSLLRPGLRRLTWFRSAWRPPVICSPALLRRPGEQITSARARYASPCLYGGFFFRSLRSLKSTGRCVPSSAPAESDLTFAGSGQIRFSLRFGLLLLPEVKR